MIDPSLPAEVSVVLHGAPHLLEQARRGGHPERSAGVSAYVLVPAFLVLMWVLLGVSGLIAAGVFTSLVSLLLLAVRSGTRYERRRLETVRAHSAAFVLPGDLDHPCRRLLARAQAAVDRVLTSQVNRAGLLDTIDNRVTLPEEVWQIAQRLSRLSAMHAEHGRIVPEELPSGLEEAFKPYSTALDAAWTSLARRVRRLEDYAKQVAKADEVFQTHLRLEALAARTPDYQRLLAETVRDDLARGHIRELAEQAARVRELFEESIGEARRTAGALLRTPLS
ncbi:hypothetical protein GCM10009560_02300 [Nonomuraea longicatena]|uniref:5-bromo-4-chloroindolyl phosphate hydrolysis protein n=1 Tax=Nonomuraea longicatena TaxID=83682 RepID=A0ABP3Z4M9_9ACTN